MGESWSKRPHSETASTETAPTGTASRNYPGYRNGLTKTASTETASTGTAPRDDGAKPKRPHPKFASKCCLQILDGAVLEWGRFDQDSLMMMSTKPIKSASRAVPSPAGRYSQNSVTRYWSLEINYHTAPNNERTALPILQRSWRGGILDSPCPSVRPSVRLSVCL